MPTVLLAFVLIFITINIIIIASIIYLSCPSLLIKAINNGCKLGVYNFVGMRIRGVDPNMIVDNLIKLKKSGIEVHPSMLEAHYLSGGNVPKVVDALIMARNRGKNIDFKYLADTQLAKRDLEEAINNI